MKLALTLPDNSQILPAGGIPTGGNDATGSLNSTLQSGITILLIMVTLLALAFLIWGGIQWIMSGGDKNAVDGARKKIIYAIVGLIIAFLAYLIINTIGNLFGAKLLDSS